MDNIPINPKTIINISPQKYGWKHLQSAEALQTLPKTTIFVNHSSEIDSLARMITSIATEEYEVITTTDNKAFVDRLYNLIKDNLNLAPLPQDIDIKEIASLELHTMPHPNNPALHAVRFVTDYHQLEEMLKAQMRSAGIKFTNDRHLSKEELESPLIIDEETFSLYNFPVKDDKLYYLSPIALRYITYIYASIIYQFLYVK